MTAIDRIRNTPLAIDVRGNSVRVVVSADKYTVALISEGMNDRVEYSKLFAAAPELLAALRDVTVQLSQCSCHRKLTVDEQIAPDAARAAIAKAEGGAK